MDIQNCHPYDPLFTTRTFDAIFLRCAGAYSDITLRGYRRDLEIFAAWCSRKDVLFVPAAPEDVASFLDDQLKLYSYATIRRRVSAIKFLHRMSDVPSPIENSAVYLALRRAARTKGRRPRQVLGLTDDLKGRILKDCPDSLIGKRDAALIGVGYDTLCRSSELAWMRVEHIDLAAKTAYIPRSKSDPFADGRLARITNETAAAILTWLESSNIVEGPLFRGLRLGHLSDGHMETSSIRRLIKASARRAKLDHNVVAGLSGHSMRVGAAQDLMTAGHDTVAIMTAGGWRNVEVVARYCEKASLLRHKGNTSSSI